MKTAICFGLVVISCLVFAAEGCYDSNRNCWLYRAQGYCSRRSRWYNYMKQSCQKSCNFCSRITKVTNIDGGTCEDSRVNGRLCPGYRSRGYCTSQFSYMNRNCRKTCGWCKCADMPSYSSRCRGWKSRGYCRYPNRYSMNRYCRRTCRYCVPTTKPKTTMKPKTTTTMKPKTQKPKTQKPKTKKPPKSTGECGRDKKTKEISIGRIIGGEKAKKNSWVWQVGLYQYEDFICGGSLLSPQYVILAAHCVRYRQEDLIIRAGDHLRNKKEASEQESEVAKVTYHDYYDGRTVENDIAILKLKTPFTLNDNVGTVCLPKAGESLPMGGTCYITGWGRTEEGSTSNVLKEAKMPIISLSDCQARNNKDDIPAKVTENMFCAGYKSGRIESGCQGDSGGPFVCKNKDGKWVLQGLVSWGSNVCDVDHRYTVFTKVKNYLQWIRERSGK